ncbi:putative pentatricopeptide repeat-containing protein At1g69350, mitochondrial [Prunus avium]|uniref:Pentatricopeptide repeat-containing protein At1g69350, mitochondrial n=1 Tax=Prunus avium TaxID=42229 RepID=A0A6P5RWD0_PRUAV|nr:putative pentatricopeptide repeat-containing protein At1g69350, mitochondrial [Prunus avium]
MTLYMPLFRSCTILRTLTQLHAHLVISGLHRDPQASTKLIESYAQMGSIQSSTRVFETFPKPDAFMWGVLMKCLVWNHYFQEAISLYHKMLHHVTSMNRFIFPSILRACSGYGDLGVGGKVHGRIIKCGFDSDVVIETSLLGLYGELRCLDNARKVFYAMPMRDVVSWSSIISCLVENGEASEGLEMFRWMVSEGVESDSVTMLGVAEACGELAWLRVARSVHGHVVRRGIKSDGALENSLISMYSKCGDLQSVERIFRRVTHWRTASWTAMISSYNQAGYFSEALDAFVEMQESKVEPNSVTLMSVLRSCIRLDLHKEGRSVHCFAIRNVLDPDLDFLGSALFELYSEIGGLSYCQKVLNTIGERNVVSWNTIISGYCQKGLLREALLIFVQMQTQGLMPDSFSMSSALSACGKVGLLELGHQIHGHIIKRGYLDEFVLNSLIDMYSKCGFVDSAYMIFDKIQHLGVITWNSMISGFSQNGDPVMAISLFDKMFLNCLEINEVAILSVIQACSELGYLEKGKWVHHKLITYGLGKDLYIDTALTDMYAKCGDLRSAQVVFDMMEERSVVSWSVMIAGYGMHGKINAAISIFTQMRDTGMQPNEITFMNILSACSHAGAVEKGRFYFRSMRDFGIEPSAEHFACIVDLLSRAGDLTGAYEIIKSMPFSVDASIWGALLNGCRIHQRMDMIKSIETDLLDISTDDSGYYTLFSNIYAEGGNWDEFGNVRLMMKGIGLRKVPGYSIIELDRQVYRFGAGDTPHPQMKEIYSFLENFQSLTRELGIT